MSTQQTGRLAGLNVFSPGTLFPTLLDFPAPILLTYEEIRILIGPQDGCYGFRVPRTCQGKAGDFIQVARPD